MLDTLFTFRRLDEPGEILPCALTGLPRYCRDKLDEDRWLPVGETVLALLEPEVKGSMVDAAGGIGGGGEV